MLIPSNGRIYDVPNRYDTSHCANGKVNLTAEILSLDDTLHVRVASYNHSQNNSPPVLFVR